MGTAYRRHLPDREPILEETKNLVSRIHHSDAWEKYQKSLRSLKEQEEVYKRVNQYRKEIMSLDDQSEDYSEEAEKVYQTYQDILCLPVVMNFLTAETRLAGKLRMMYDCLAEELMMDISYMD